MKKTILLAMLCITVGMTSCTKEKSDYHVSPTDVQQKNQSNPMLTATFLKYVALSRQGDLQNTRFESFPNIPIEFSKNLFDEVLTVYVPLKEEQSGGELTEHAITVYPALEIFEDPEYGESITGESAAQFLTGTIDEIVEYVNGLSLDGFKYISYIYTSVHSQDDDVMVMKVHFGLVNNSMGPFGAVECDPIDQMYNPISLSALFQIESILNSEECNPNLRLKLRSGNTHWPSHPSNYGQQLAPGFVWHLAYSGNVINQYISPNVFSDFYNSPNPYTFWSEIMPLTSNPTEINAGVLKEHISAMAYRAQDGSFFPILANYYDPVGYTDLVSIQSSPSFSLKSFHHEITYKFQQLKWIAVPDPDYWNININAGLTPSLNP